MSEIRILGAEDWRSMQRLRMSRPTHAGARVSTFTSNPLHTVNPVYKNRPHLAVGLFEEGKLESFICCFAKDDYWILDLMIASGDPKTLRECLEFCLNHYEAQGVFQFYYAFPNKWARTYRSFWKDGSPTLRKYTIEDKYIIEPNKIPTDKWVWETILHSTVVPVEFLVRRSYVKEK